MYQNKQLEDSLQQVRQSFNSLADQINQQLNTLEMIARSMSNQPGQQQSYSSPQQQSYTRSGQYSGYGGEVPSSGYQNRQYSPGGQNTRGQGYQYTQSGQYAPGNQSSQSGQYSQGNQYTQAGQLGGVNRNTRENLYGGQAIPGSSPAANQSSINPISGLSEDKPTMQQQSGVNRYGAEYSSEKDRGK